MMMVLLVEEKEKRGENIEFLLLVSFLVRK
jgi:hypothetical protein